MHRFIYEIDENVFAAVEAVEKPSVEAGTAWPLLIYEESVDEWLRPHHALISWARLSQCKFICRQTTPMEDATNTRSLLPFIEALADGLAANRVEA